MLKKCSTSVTYVGPSHSDILKIRNKIVNVKYIVKKIETKQMLYLNTK